MGEKEGDETLGDGFEVTFLLLDEGRPKAKFLLIFLGQKAQNGCVILKIKNFRRE